MPQRRMPRRLAQKTRAALAGTEKTIGRWEREMSSMPTTAPYKRRFGSFRGWELGHVIDWLGDTRVQSAGTTEDGVQLYAVFERPARHPRAAAARLRAFARANNRCPGLPATSCGLVPIPGLYEGHELAALGFSADRYHVEDRGVSPGGRRLFGVFARDASPRVARNEAG